NDDLSIVICFNLHLLRRQREYSRLDWIHVVSTRDAFPPNHSVPWLQGFTHRCSFQHTCDLPSTRPTRPPQDQTPTVYCPGKIRHDGHVTAVGTPDVLQDTLLEVWRDGFPE